MQTRKVKRNQGTRRSTKGAVYFTHDNGARPFRVEVRGGTVSVFGNAPTYDKKVLYIPRYERVMVGANRGRYANKHEGAHEGSSLLVHVSGRKYIFIGHRVLKFTARDSIKEFHGIMGNSDVVYAFAIGEENTYFFVGDKYMPNDAINMSKNPYETYFANQAAAKRI